MKQIMRLCVVLIMVFGLAGPAASAVTVFTADVNTTIDQASPSLFWVFSDAGSNGDFLTDVLNNYNITSITLTVDMSGIDGSYAGLDYTGEGGRIYLNDGTSIGTVGGNTLSITLDVTEFLSQLESNDTFYMGYLTRGTGSFDGFTVGSATLEVAHVPLPTTALLLTIGIAGMIRIQRRL